MEEQENAKQELQKNVDDYLEIVKELIQLSDNPPNFEIETDKKKLIEYKNKFMTIRKELYRIQYSMSVVKCDPKKTKVKNNDGVLVEIGIFDVGAKEWLDRVQNRFLHPVLLRLSELSSAKSNLLYFVLGLVTSVVIGVFTPKILDLLPTWFKEKESMNIIEGIEDLKQQIEDLKQTVSDQTYKLDSIQNVEQR